jgi:hypothetical protein
VGSIFHYIDLFNLDVKESFSGNISISNRDITVRDRMEVFLMSGSKLLESACMHYPLMVLESNIEAKVRTRSDIYICQNLCPSTVTATPRGG